MKRSTDRSAASSAGPGTGTRLLKFLLLAGVTVSVMALGDCDPKGPSFFDLIGGPGIPGTGDIIGQVTVDGDPEPGATVTLRQNGTVVGTDVTDSSGNYSFPNRAPGTYTVSTAITGATCPGEQTAAVVADQTTTRNIACTTTPAENGTLTVDVLVGTTPQPGATVQISGPVSRTATTNSSGTASFPDLPPGQYTASATLTGHTCTSASGTVQANQTTNVDVPCTAQTGSVTGTVTVNGVGQSGVTVTLLQGTTPVGTATTGAGGTYTISNVAPGTYTAQVTPPANTTCNPTSQSVTVPAGGSGTANFACTGTSGDFTVGLNQPPPGWLHDMPGVSSLECKLIRTTPAQPGASFSSTTTGPGVVTPQPVTGTLNANGEAQLQVRINAFGTYVNTVTVTVGSVTRTQTQTVTVLPTPNTCPALSSSSARFKRDIVALMPRGATILGLRPVAFNYLAPYGDPAVRVVGFLAEEVVRVYPRAVELDEQGRPLGIYYRALAELVLGEVEARASRAVGAAVARVRERF